MVCYGRYVFAWVALGTLCLSGCSDSAAPGTQATSRAAHSHGHAHASQGPHGGSIIELGTEERHAEIVQDDLAGSVTVYFLDSTGRQPAPIEEEEVHVNLRHDGQARQFKLQATPDDGETAGSSSRFVSLEQELADQLNHSDAHGQLVVSFRGKQYRGNIGHHHDDHSHADKKLR